MVATPWLLWAVEAMDLIPTDPAQWHRPPLKTGWPWTWVPMSAVACWRMAMLNAVSAFWVLLADVRAAAGEALNENGMQATEVVA